MGLKKKLTIKKRCDQLTWNGDELSKYCGHCDKTVLNLSARTEEEAKELLASGTLECVSYLRKPDGNVRFKPYRVLPLVGALAASMACGSTGPGQRVGGAPVAADADSAQTRNASCAAEVRTPERHDAPTERLTGEPAAPQPKESATPAAAPSAAASSNGKHAAPEPTEPDERWDGEWIPDVDD